MDAKGFILKNRIAAFVALVFLISIVGYITKSYEFLMFCPALIVLAFLILRTTSLSDLGIKRCKLMYLLAAYLIPLFAYLLLYLLICAFGLGKIDLSRIIPKEFYSVEGVPQDLLIKIALIFQLTFGFFINLILCFGEEIGWRGFLVPEIFRKTNSIVKTGLITGMIWSIWHWPMIIFGEYKESSIGIYLGLILFTLDIVSGSIIFAYLRMKSGSVWPAVILHASVNTFIQGIFTPIIIGIGAGKYFLGEFGVGGIIVNVFVLVGFCLAKTVLTTRKKEVPNIIN